MTAMLFAAIFGVGIGLQIGGLGAELDPVLGMWVAVIGAASMAALLTTYRPEAEVDDRDAEVAEAAWNEFHRELRRARRHARSLSLVRLVTSEPGADRDDAPAPDPGAIVRRIGLHLRLMDRAWVDGRSVFVLLPESRREAAETLLARVRESVPDLITATPRIATFPDDGLTSGALIGALHDAGIEPVPLPRRAGSLVDHVPDEAVSESAGRSS